MLSFTEAFGQTLVGPREGVTRNQKQGYQWPVGKKQRPPFLIFFKMKTNFFLFNLPKKENHCLTFIYTKL